MPSPSSSQEIGIGTPCDVDHFNALRARAWLERQRELTQNQNLIVKPDSVLEYTCFGQHVKRTGLLLRRLGTHAVKWEADDLLGGVLSKVDEFTDIFIPLAHTVLIPQGVYLKLNYPHTWLGGRAEDGKPDLDAVGDFVQDLLTDLTSTNYSYTCDVMEKVWTEAKCMDFIDEPSHDGFYTFKEYSEEDDFRRLPDACVSLFKSKYENNLAYATVDDETPVVEDVINTHIDLLSPENCASLPPIATGLTVETSNGVRYPEKICAAPGCHYNPDIDKCDY